MMQEEALITGAPAAESDWRADVAFVAQQLAMHCRGPVILIDDDQLRNAIGTGSGSIPFLEKRGAYWGPPPDDGTAIRELERLRAAGATHVAIAWPSFWWLQHYSGFARYLRATYGCILDDPRLILFDLADGNRKARTVSMARSALSMARLRDLAHASRTTAARFSTFLRLARQLRGPDAEPVVHLVELLASAYDAGLPVIDLETALTELLPASSGRRTDVVLHPHLRGAGSGSVAEMAVLSAMVAATQPRAILEFGTCDGCSTWHLWANAPRDCRIVTLDLPSHTKVEGSSDLGLQGIAARPYLPVDPRVTLVETDSRTWRPDLPSGVDFCFIDAGHTYECVRNDTEKAMSVLNDGGLLLWHDATWRKDEYGVNRYLKELRANGLEIFLVQAGAFDYCSIAIHVKR